MPIRVHPRDPLGCGRLVQRVQDHGPASLFSEAHESREQLRSCGPVGLRHAEQQVARDAVRELHKRVARELAAPLCERVLALGDVGDLPVAVDVDDHITMLWSAQHLSNGEQREGFALRSRQPIARFQSIVVVTGRQRLAR